jgi:phosphohistidine phosphatase SixA
VGLRLCWALPLFLLVLLAAPAVALADVYLVRHAEKADFWPDELDSFRPLSSAGVARADALAKRLAGAGIAAIYTSRTTRALATAMPLAQATHVAVVADEASARPDEMSGFLARLREKHAADRAVLIVGHSNTVPELLGSSGSEAGLLSAAGDHRPAREPADRGVRGGLEGGSEEAGM